ncbi:MAG: hypothetical protein N3A60_04755 [Thermanaerothrix sp.]|nr:hypothetical protein [Thermanaerothrix sp.]
MVVVVDVSRSIRYGFCETMAFEVFSLDSTSDVQVILEPIPWHFQDLVYQAVEKCPEHAIRAKE